MGNTCRIVNQTGCYISVFTFNEADFIYQSYCNNTVYVIPPYSDKEVQSYLKSSRGLKVAVITHINHKEYIYTYDRWRVKYGTDMIITHVDYSNKHITVEGNGCRANGKQLSYKEGNYLNFRQSFHVLRHMSSQSSNDAEYMSTDTLFIDNTNSHASVKLMNINVVVSCACSRPTYYVTEAVSDPDLEYTVVKPGSTMEYSCIKMPSVEEFLYPESWDSPNRFHVNRSLRHLLLKNGMKYTFLDDEVTQNTTAIIRSDLDAHFLKIVPYRGIQSRHSLRMRVVVSVLNRLYPCNSKTTLSTSSPSSASMENKEAEHITEDISEEQRIVSYHYDNIKEVLDCALASREVYFGVKNNDIAPTREEAEEVCRQTSSVVSTSAPYEASRVQSSSCSSSEIEHKDIPDDITENGISDWCWEPICSGDVDLDNNELTRWALWKTKASSMCSCDSATCNCNNNSETTSSAVLVFRGTDLEESFQDLLHDLSCQPIKIFGSVFVHSGFNTAVENIYETVLSRLMEFDIDTFCVTGHSLGGALAQVFALKYLITHKYKRPDKSPELRRSITFGSPMTLFCNGDVSEEDAEKIRPWTEVCVNYVYQADPIPLMPRLLSCKFCWNALVRMASQSHWIGSFVQNFLTIPEESDIPPGNFLKSLAITRGFRPPGISIILQADGKSPLVLNSDAMQRLASTYDTYVSSVRNDIDDHLSHNYIRSLKEAVGKDGGFERDSGDMVEVGDCGCINNPVYWWSASSTNMSCCGNK